MTHIDFSPLLRAAIGFDNVFRTLESTSRAADGFPAYDVEQLDDGRYRITLAVAGYREGELEVVAERDALVVRARPEAEAADRVYLRRGIARRAFERKFVLADRIVVEGAKLDGGLLTIELKKVVPEEDKPRRIAISG